MLVPIRISLAAVTVLLGLITFACAEEQSGDAPPATAPASAPAAAPAPAADGRPAVVGAVKDAAGKPIEGAVVVADATLFYNTNLEARTKRDGSYRIELPREGMQTTWNVTASLRRKYHDKTYRFDLHPDDAEPFAGPDGAVRNFEWRLSGEKPEDRGLYGSHVVAYTELLSDLLPESIELTLTPDGPLVDGSEGKPITGKLVSTPEGWAIADVPVGRYRITARYVPDGEQPAPLQVRWRNKGQYVDALVADFDSPYGATMPIHRIDLEVRRPK